MKKAKLTRKIIDQYGKESEKDKKLFEECEKARRRGYLIRKEFIKICDWKTNRRPQRHYRKNSEKSIRKVTSKAFSLRDEEKKIKLLDILNGVGVRSASALLTVVYPKKYGIMDVRAWNSLRNFNKVPKKEKKSFSYNDWLFYIKLIRNIAKKYNVSPRKIDLTLYNFDKYRK